jgi:hypothetical protein
MPGHNLRAVELQTCLLHNRLLSPDSENGSRRDLLALRRRYRCIQLHPPGHGSRRTFPSSTMDPAAANSPPAIDTVGASSPSDVDLVGIAAASTRAMYLVRATSPPAIDPVGASSPSAMDLVGSTSPATTTHRMRGSSTRARAAAALGSDDGARTAAVGSDRERPSETGKRGRRG